MTGVAETMWIENFRQFLDRSHQRAGEWARGVVHLRTRFVRFCIDLIGESLPARQGVEHANASLAANSLQSDWRAEITYRFQSLRCDVRVCIAEPTPGMKIVYRVLQEVQEAQPAETCPH